MMVTSGKDKGKTGKVLAVYLEQSRALVEGINLAKKHMRKSREDQPGGIVSTPKAVSLSVVMPFCKNCNRAVKVGFSLAKDKSKARICKRCKQTL